MRRLALSALALAAAATLGCASAGFTPQTPTMPAARQALRPEYRIFYDALTDYGDWVLIEPYGFVFHPKVDYASWRPYSYGFWAPSDTWGWVWISGEPFGWATYHYGSWLFDRFQGWVWMPGVDWGPAWVSWQMAGNYAGWAPLGPQGGDPWISSPPAGGATVYAPLASLTATDLSAHVVPPAEAAPIAASARPVENIVERDGVRFPFGPPFERVERAIGRPLTRVSIQELIAAGGAAASGQTRAGRGDHPAAPPPADAAAARIETMRRAGEDAARRVREAIANKAAAPARVPVVRPPWIRRVEDETRGPGAAPDTTR
ncbi:MAG: hypothetical protein HYR74_04360 [Candidatus Eisenbacteria bacterium]|nr:hypothetical protein [Candidatus Eisenbacteria bacterium]